MRSGSAAFTWTLLKKASAWHRASATKEAWPPCVFAQVSPPSCTVPTEPPEMRHRLVFVGASSSAIFQVAAQENPCFLRFLLSQSWAGHCSRHGSSSCQHACSLTEVSLGMTRQTLEKSQHTATFFQPALSRCTVAPRFAFLEATPGVPGCKKCDVQRAKLCLDARFEARHQCPRRNTN